MKATPVEQNCPKNIFQLRAREGGESPLVVLSFACEQFTETDDKVVTSLHYELDPCDALNVDLIAPSSTPQCQGCC